VVGGTPGTYPWGPPGGVVRDGSPSWTRLAQSGPAEAGPAVPARCRVESARVDGILTGRLEEDDVMDDARPLRLDGRTRDVGILRELRLEQEAVVVVEPTDCRLGLVRPRRSEGHRRAGCAARVADGLDSTTVTDLRSPAHPARDELFLCGRQDALCLVEVRGGVAA